MRVSIIEKYRFPGGIAIFKNGSQVIPDTDEGRTIIKILSQQKETKKENEKQREKFIETTYPRPEKAKNPDFDVAERIKRIRKQED